MLTIAPSAPRFSTESVEDLGRDALRPVITTLVGITHSSQVMVPRQDCERTEAPVESYPPLKVEWQYSADEVEPLPSNLSQNAVALTSHQNHYYTVACGQIIAFLGCIHYNAPLVEAPVKVQTCVHEQAWKAIPSQGQTNLPVRPASGGLRQRMENSLKAPRPTLERVKAQALASLAVRQKLGVKKPS